MNLLPVLPVSNGIAKGWPRMAIFASQVWTWACRKADNWLIALLASFDPQPGLVLVPLHLLAPTRPNSMGVRQ